MTKKYEKLKTLLKELFQLDQPDLDFGLYRIMHAKSAEVSQFLDKDLLPQVKQAFSLYKNADKAELEKDLAKAVEQAQGLGVDPETTQKVKDLRKRLASEAVDIGNLESEVYDHLFSFFRRYYSEGDFLSKRVYKPGVYAIPYEGEEVKLHWANADQYYIKTSEYLRDYAFRLHPENDQKPMRVHFRLADAAEGEHGNIKATEGKDRRFKLASENTLSIEDDELIIRFTYQPDPAKQADLNAAAEAAVLGAKDKSLIEWIHILEAQHQRTDGTESEKSRLRVHLDRYTARNTFDYFIHKDLGPFLRRELDFYIKNEVMHLDDIENESIPRVEQYLSKIKVIRSIAGKIIEFLAQLEDFQKKLWLKKKFVVETSYCIRVGCIPEKFYSEILTNKAQHQEWIKLCAINEIKGDLATQGYEKKLTPRFLKGHPTLMVDTQYLDADLKEQLLEVIVDLDEQSDGVLFHSENFQMLSLIQDRYRGQIPCVYIDPPYNTDASAIDYKNGYKASSWMSLLNDRLLLSRRILAKSGVLIAAIDDEQQRELSFLLSASFDNRLLGTICVRANPSGRPTKTGYSVSHEYMLFAGNGDDAEMGRMPPTVEQSARFSQSDDLGPFEWRNLRREGSNSDRSARPALYYPIYICDGSIRIPKMDWDPDTRAWGVLETTKAGETAVWPNNEDKVEKTWRWEWQTVLSRLNEVEVRQDRTGRDYVYLKRRPHAKGVVSVSSWFDAKYSATEHGTAVLKALFGQSPFSYPKSIHAVSDGIYIGGADMPDAIVMDYFAGSGTTGHAVVNLNRLNGGQRRFLLAEQGDYFDTVLLPRLKKVTFTPEWKNGKPKRLATPEEAERSPRIMKVVRLESYEDALNNLEPRRSDTQEQLLLSNEAQGTDGFKEQYMLRYMLDVETRGSQSLLNIQAFSDPTAYTLKVKRPGSDETREVNVDLLETFNWLIGLTVKHIAAPKSYKAGFKRDKEKRLILNGDLEQDSNGPFWFRTVTGTTPDGRQALIIWRKLTGKPEEDNLALEAWFKQQAYFGKDSEVDLVYVNGGNNLENIKAANELWKVRLIEEDFHRLMFDTDNT